MVRAVRSVLSLALPLAALLALAPREARADDLIEGLLEDGDAKPPPRAKPRAKGDDADMVFDADEAAPAGDAPTDAAKPPGTPGVRRVVVANFDEPEGFRVRLAALEVLSLQGDIEVLGYNDVTVVARRLGVDPMSSHGRLAVSEELGVFAWLDGRVSEDFEAHLRLTDAGGKELAWLKVRGQSRGTLNDTVKKNLWRAVGPPLSDAEKRRQALEARHKLAQKKKQARDEEAMRQRELAAKRRERIRERLAAAKSLAKEKAKARNAELDHQAELVAERRAEEEQKAREAERERQQQLAAERQRQMEEERQAALARQQQPAYAEPASSWGGGGGSSLGGGGGGSSFGASDGGQASGEPPAGTPGGVSPAMQEWLERRRRGGASSGGGSFGGGAAPPPEPPAGVSPETRAWLERQRGGQ